MTTQECIGQVTQDKLYASSTGDLAALLGGCAFPDNAFFLAENLPAHAVTDRQARQDLLYFTRVRDVKKRNIDIGSYTSGRIFCPEFELRWQHRRDTGGTQLVYTGPEAAWPDLLKPYLDNPLDAKESFSHYQPRHYYLFGEALQQARLGEMGLPAEVDEARWYYAEVRIPRLLRYPYRPAKPERQRVQLIVSEYINEDTQEVLWSRFRDLEEERLKTEKGEKS